MDQFVSKGYKISNNNSDINLDKLHKFLSFDSYWSKGISLERLKTAIINSVNFTLLSPENKFIGFGRVITDQATFAYLSDVYVDEEYSGVGLGKFLIKYIMNYIEALNLRRVMLATKDAQILYKKFGWEELQNPDFLMEIVKIEI